ncbi:MAG: phage head-tail connector protein [Clostridia bacterium]|nr:phage head-tail connector protein [Clostridia bacterium]
MEDKINQILAATKLIAGITNDNDDELLLLLIDDAINAVLSYCRIEFLPRQLESFIPTIVARQFDGRAHIGVKSVTEGERRVEYRDGEYDFLSEYSVRLKPFINRSVKLPSDLESEENEPV